MKFVTYEHEADVAAGVLEDGVVFPLPAGVTTLDVVASGLAAALEAGAHAVRHGRGLDVATVRLRAPLRPRSVRDFVTFEEHVQGVRRAIEGSPGVPEAWYDAPTFYFTNPHRISGPGDGVPMPSRCRKLDFELEVAAVVGAAGSSLTLARARDHIFGYTVMNDWSARDIQAREMQVGLGPAKGKDFDTTLGPCLVTADEFADRHDDDGFLELLCTADINGTSVGCDVLSNMGWTFAAMVAYASRDSLVLPGDVLGSGTVGNGGSLAELWGRRGVLEPAPLRPGDTVTLRVEGIGTLTNSIVAGVETPELPAFRRRDPGQARSGYSVRPRVAS